MQNMELYTMHINRMAKTPQRSANVGGATKLFVRLPHRKWRQGT